MTKKSKKKYLIRPATFKDYLDIHNICFETWMVTYPNKKFNIREEDIRYKFEKKTKKKNTFKTDNKKSRLLLEFSGKIVAFCNCEEKKGFNQLQAIYVLPKYQGVGFAYALWEESKKIFNPQKDIIVNVASYNKKAINFYKKLGFKSTGKVLLNEKHKMRNGAIIPELEMIIKSKIKNNNLVVN